MHRPIRRIDKLTPTSQLEALVLHALDELKARDVHVLDVRALTCITDTMIICSGTSRRHVAAIADNVMQQAKQHHFPVLGHEGKDSSEWVLVDLNSILVHVMQPAIRELYDLEKLWGHTPKSLAALG